jgi:hypothetical protein
MKLFTTEQIGRTQSLTPEGFLLCQDVPVARVGKQIYNASDLPGVRPGHDGLITVVREESEVFRPETVASFEGKSITVLHQFVDPSNVKTFEVGHGQNFRRSEIERDLMICDLLIKDEKAIKLVRFDPKQPTKKTLRQISLGYDADYVEAEPGLAFQRNIIGNHIALVERGRAGPRCSIQDEDTMSKATAPTLLQKVLRAFRTGDSDLIEKTVDEAEAEEKRVADEETAEEEKKERQATTDAISTLTQTVAALAKTVADLGKPAKTKDEAAEELETNDEETAEEKEKRMTDEAAAEEEKKVKTEDSMRDTISRAEILVPGFTAPTLDSVTDANGVAAVQRKVLSEALKTQDGKTAYAGLLGGRTVDELTVDAVGTVFLAASELARQKNNAKGAVTALKTKDFGSATSAATINARNSEFYKKS